MRVDFFIGGTQKADVGTGSFLRQHPDCMPQTKKKLHFFDRKLEGLITKISREFQPNRRSLIAKRVRFYSQGNRHWIGDFHISDSVFHPSRRFP